MAKPSIALSELLEKGSDTDLLREMIQHIVQRVMEMDVENICAASYGERNPERQNSRNGYRERRYEREDPEAAFGQLLPTVPGTAQNRREGTRCGDPGSVYPGRLDPFSGRTRQGDGHDRHLQEPGQPALRGDRRAGQRVP